MQKQAEFGTGCHKVRFIWNDVLNKSHYVQYKASTRKGIARIMRKFLNALKQLNSYAQKASIQRALNNAIPFGYLWLAARSPKCEIHTRDKHTNKPIKRHYSFTYLLPNTCTLRGLWRRIQLGKNINF